MILFLKTHRKIGTPTDTVRTAKYVTMLMMLIGTQSVDIGTHDVNICTHVNFCPHDVDIGTHEVDIFTHVDIGTHHKHIGM